MYDENTLYEEMIEDIPSKYDKSEGSFVSDFVRAASISDATLYETLQLVADKLYVANLEAEELDLFIYERTGLTRKQSTQATGQITVSGNASIEIGDLFETESGVRFVATEDITITTTGKVHIESVENGALGNVLPNTITKMPISIAGITSVTNELATSGGFDLETDTEFIIRYFDYIQKPVTSGNKYYYRRYALENLKVGDAKVIPLWNGVNTVKVVIVDRDKRPANEDVVREVQEMIDPNSLGIGEGIAPLGAKCTVVAANPFNVNITTTVVLDGELTLEDVKVELQNNIAEYLESIAFKSNTISIAKLGAVILGTKGIADYSVLKLNNGSVNVTMQDTDTPILQGVVVNV